MRILYQNQLVCRTTSSYNWWNLPPNKTVKAKAWIARGFAESEPSKLAIVLIDHCARFHALLRRRQSVVQAVKANGGMCQVPIGLLQDLQLFQPDMM